ncbi:probable salivary secreted peptide [Rhodnius prolixus]|uniref:Putative conserved secreted protein n=1 Tax=Rhodnius prolixus TaxID=13249 RepID=R4G3K6_RHOPR
MGIKLVFLLILGISASVWAYPKTDCGSGPEHNLVQGRREPGGRLLFTTRVKMPKSYFRVQSYDIKWPNSSGVTFDHITRFEVHDQLHDGTGGCAFLSGGGPGKNFIKFHLKTQRGGSYDFVIKIYGR